MTFDDVTDPYKLLSLGIKQLMELHNVKRTLTISASDSSHSNDSFYDPFRLGTYVLPHSDYHSNIHELDEKLLIKKIIKFLFITFLYDLTHFGTGTYLIKSLQLKAFLVY